MELGLVFCFLLRTLWNAKGEVPAAGAGSETPGGDLLVLGWGGAELQLELLKGAVPQPWISSCETQASLRALVLTPLCSPAGPVTPGPATLPPSV